MTLLQLKGGILKLSFSVVSLVQNECANWVLLNTSSSFYIRLPSCPSFRKSIIAVLERICPSFVEAAVVSSEMHYSEGYFFFHLSLHPDFGRRPVLFSRTRRDINVGKVHKHSEMQLQVFTTTFPFRNSCCCCWSHKRGSPLVTVILFIYITKRYPLIKWM